jgi:uroporphyrinogen-III synthase
MPTVGITADRRAEEQAVLFARFGIDTVLGAALGTIVDPSESPLEAVTKALIADPPDDVVANTGFGIRAWLAAAGEWGVEDSLKRALSGSRIVARGPKAAGAIRSAGLPLAWRATTEQLVEVAAHLVEQGVAGHRVAVQRHGVEDAHLAGALQAAGAIVIDVPVYRWTVPPDRGPAVRLVESVCEGGIDAVTFTSGPAIRNLLAISAQVGLDHELVAACNDRVLTACVGPVCAAVAEELGLHDPLVPEHWRLGAMVRLVAERLGAA